MNVPIREAIYAANDEVASRVHTQLSSRGIFTVNILGSPGAGKTSLIIRIAEVLKSVESSKKLAVIEGDIASDIDTQTLLSLGIPAYQINTGGDCHLNAPMIEAVLSRMPIADRSWLFIENIGNLICPADFTIGEDLKIVVASVAEGSDKPYKYPLVFSVSAACALSKIDLAEAVGFQEAYFRSGYASAASAAPLFPLNAKTGAGVPQLVDWLIGTAKGLGL